MDAQTLVVLLLVAAAAVYVGRKAWAAMRSARQPQGGCGGSCGCSGDPAAR